MFEEEDEKPSNSDSGKRPGQGNGSGDGEGKGPPKGMGFKNSRFLFILIIGGILVALIVGAQSQLSPKIKDVKNFMDLIQEIEDDKIKEVTIDGQDIVWTYKAGEPNEGKYKKFHVVGPRMLSDADKKILYTAAKKNGVIIRYLKPSQWPAIILSLIPWLLIFLVIYFFVFRQLRGPGGPGGVLSFGKSRATLITKDKTRKTFKDVAGIDEAKEEVEELVGFLKNPKKFQRLGGRIPRGVLLIGPPGTGKTLLAKAIAGEAEVPFYSISGSDFVEMFVGVGASRVRDLFQQARENSPCIIFLDEIDAVGRRRGTGLGGGHDEREQTLNEILVQMDGMESDVKIIVMAATNRPDVLDPALLRPGRFDRHVYVDFPDIKGREEILKVHAKKVKMAESVDLHVLAKATPMHSGADLENIINEAALIAVMSDKDGIELSDLEEARDKVAWGREKRSRVLDEADRWITAYHEAGHALLGHYLPNVDRPHKITIMPRGPSLGATHFLPSKDILNRTRTELLAQIQIAFGGRIAEEMFVKDISTGAKGDIDSATNIARKMVCEWGMSDKLGPIKYQDDEETVFLGREISKTTSHSGGTAEMIDSEIRRIVDESYKKAEVVLEAHRDDIELLAQALMEYEVVSGEELDILLKERKLPESRLPSHEVKPRPLPKQDPMSGKEEPKRDEGTSFSGPTISPQPA